MADTQKQPILDLRNITKQYTLGPVVVNALKGVSIQIHEGEMVAIVGPSGCGKSTLMNIMGLLDRGSTGEYYVNGKEVSTLDDNELSSLRNRTIGFVFQSYNLLARLNVLNNVSIPLLYRGMSKEDFTPICREMLNLVNMGDREHHKPNELSGGQQQRVAIARALAGSPSLILADEPTGALDVKTSEDIINLFTRLNKEEGITVVVITHDIEVAERCPRQIVLRDGLVFKETRTK